MTWCYKYTLVFFVKKNYQRNFQSLLNQRYGHFICVLLFLVISKPSYSQSFILNQEPLTTKTYLPDHNILMFEDTTGALSFQDIQNPNIKTHFSLRQAHRVYNKQSNIWMQFSVINRSASLRKELIFLNDWDISIWLSAKDSISYLGRQGILVKNTKSNIFFGENYNSTITLEINPKDTVTFYLKTRGLLDKKLHAIAIQDQAAVSKKAQFDLWVMGTFTGCFLLMFLANIFLISRSPKSRNIFYTLHIVSIFLFWSGVYGIDFFIPFIWPIHYSFFLPTSSLFYALFVLNFLKLNKGKTLNGKVFQTYIILLSIAIIALSYFYSYEIANYYRLLPTINKIGFYFLLYSFIVVLQVSGKQKVFILVGLVFLFIGHGVYYWLHVISPDHQSFVYPMTGSILEMGAFLLGNFYLLNEDRKQAFLALQKKQDELRESKKQLDHFSLAIQEKNKLIEQFKDRMHNTSHKDEKQIEYLQQLSESIILTEKDWEEFQQLFNTVHKYFLVRLKLKEPNLTESEVRLVALTKLKLSTKEISCMLGISPKSVNKSRYRLKKKLSENSNKTLEELVAT